MKLVKAAEEIIGTQDYSPQKMIEGVELVELKRFTGADGSFNELVRLERNRVKLPEEMKGFEIKQINHSRAVPGTLKAWHLHLEQDEIWFVHPEGKLIVGLLDLRERSKSKEISMKFSLGDGRAHLLYIPRGVAHGLSNPYKQEATMTYLVNNWFDGSDEKRLPFDFLVGADFWQIEKG